MLLAKSGGTSLARHTFDVWRCAAALRDHNLQGFPEEWWSDILKAAIYHDLGKADPDVQRVLENKLRQATFPHSLLSLLLFSAEQCVFPAEVLGAVAFHHWRERFPEYLLGLGDEMAAKADSISFDADYWNRRLEEFKQDLQLLMPEQDLGSIQVNNVLLEYLRYHSLADSGLLLPPYSMNFLPSFLQFDQSARRDCSAGGECAGCRDQCERRRVFFLGTLLRADHFASWIEENPGVSPDEIELGTLPDLDIVADKMRGMFPDFWQCEFFDAHPALRTNDLIFIGGTGVGKTELAYLWAAGHKAFMALPMRAAVNKQWDRAQAIFAAEPGMGLQQIGLLHGNASLDIVSRIDQQQEAMTTVSLARHLASPFIIATADQLAPAALRYPGYERIFSALMGNCLIVDEIQAYDPKAAAIMTHLLQVNHFFGGKSLVMTATLPPFIRSKLEEKLSEQIINVFEDNVFEDKMKELGDSRHHRIGFTVINNWDELLPEAAAHCQNGRRVLIIVNTVRTAQVLFDKLQQQFTEEKLLLLHARFTGEDRADKEQLVTEQYLPNQPDYQGKGCIVIATQVVEASLDIDADIMYTEPAPADSLVQRMGRVARRNAHLVGDNAPAEPNVIIVIPKLLKSKTATGKKADGDVTSLGAPVYDRDLVAASLALLVAYARVGAMAGSGYGEIAENWSACFRSKDRDKLQKPDLALIDALDGYSGSFTISEREKGWWVERAFEVLEDAQHNPSGVYLGRYLKEYAEVLDILEHGYCSDSKLEAERLFRKIVDVQGVPKGLVDDFKTAVQQWAETGFDEKNGLRPYDSFAYEILRKYVVSCDRRGVGGSEPGLPDKLVPAKLEEKKRNRLLGWIGDLVVIDRSYDHERGLDRVE